MKNPFIASLERNWGVHFMGVDAGLQLENIAHDFDLAMDAQPSLVTVSNSAIPAYLSTYVDPKVIKVLQSPMKAVDIVGGEVKKGDWTTPTASFPVAEPTGEVSSYGDYSNNGIAGANINWPERQSYHYQTITQWGEKELAMMGLGRIDWANQQNMASILTLNKFQNKTYFFGVDGLRNYGLLNDPTLPASIAPTSEAGNVTWATKDALGVYADIKLLVATLITQSNSILDIESPMTLAMSPTSEAIGLTNTTNFNVNVMDQIKKNFPNMTIKTAPEYETEAGQLVQLIATNVEAQQTVDMAFTEKLRAHPVILDVSSFKQKKSQGTWGAIIYRPIFIASMLGV